MPTQLDQDARRAELYALLGDLPPRHRPIAAHQIGQRSHDGFIEEQWTFDFNGIEEVPGVFVRPEQSAGRRPTILYNHYHGGDYDTAKRELVDGNTLMQKPAYAIALTARGYNALCIDQWAFGQRKARSEAECFKYFLWQGRVMWGMMVYDSLRAIDWLITRDDVDADRIGTLGLSMGSTMAWWLAALDTRIACCVDLCCLTDFQELIATGNLNGHGVYYYVPGLLKHFTASQINALIVPRTHLALQGNRDDLTPPRGLDRIDADLKNAYAQAGAPDAWQMLRWDVGHGETAEMRQAALAWLDRWLRPEPRASGLPHLNQRVAEVRREIAEGRATPFDPHQR